MPVKNLKTAYLRVAVDSFEQLECAVKFPSVDLIYIDAGYFASDSWKEIVKMIHKGTGGFGKLAALRLPQIWRKKSKDFFNGNGACWKNSGFDAYLAENVEEVIWLKENGISDEMIITDAGIYCFNSYSEDALSMISGIGKHTTTLPLELNGKEIKKYIFSQKANNSENDTELIIYGRAPLMVTAQCMRKTTIGCDRRMSDLWMKDRTGAMMAVKNCCTFCINTIYNSVPTVLYDLENEINELSPSHIRYEFTVENVQQMETVLKGIVPEQFTRGHFKRGVL